MSQSMNPYEMLRRERVRFVQGYAGTGKTTMLNRACAMLEKKGYTVRVLAPCIPSRDAPSTR